MKIKGTIVVVVGVPGSGKSVILSAAKEQDPAISIENYGKAMLSVAGKAEIDRDRMRHLSPDEQAALGISAAELIVEKAKGEQVALVDTHALIRSPFGYVPGLPLPVLQTLQPRGICVVEAPPEFVLKCREGDQQRFREKMTVGDIERHQELTRQFAVSCVALSGCVLQFVENRGKPPEEACKPLLEFIRHLRQGE